MPAYRFPILVWQDHGGRFTAAPVDDAQGAAAFGESAADAVEQIKDHLQHLYRKNPWWPEPDFVEPRLISVKVEVRPEYQSEEQARGRTEVRTYPARETLTLRVPCVHGKERGGMLVGALPTLDMRFTYYEPESLRQLVVHYVQNALKGLIPGVVKSSW